MFIKKLDWLSPPITLYFKGENQHNSIFSAILSIICYILVSIMGVYYSLEFIHRENPKAYFFNRYIVDAGYFPVNSTSMFNFIQICNQRTNEVIPFDFTIFKAIGLDDVFYDEYMNNPNNLKNINHWIYGYCNNNTDTQGISHLINFDYYEQSACIRKYYDKNKKKYFNTGDPEFRWPVIQKGCSNPNRTYYGIIIQRCDKSPDILKNQSCKSEEEISDYINKVSLKFQLIDYYADMLNYEMPFTKFFYEVTSAITNGIFIINHLNFNPANMLTHNGFIFDKRVEEHSYFFIQNEKHTIGPVITPEVKTTNGCLIGIYFWMQNTLQHFERNYDRFQDLLSDIGGINSIVITIGYYFNLLIHNFIIVLDTQDLVLNRDHVNYKEKGLEWKPTIIRKANLIMSPPKKNYLVKSYLDDLQSQSSSNYLKFVNDNIKIMPNNNEKSDNNINIYIKRKNVIKKKQENNKEEFHINKYKLKSIVLSENENSMERYKKYNTYEDIRSQNKIKRVTFSKDKITKVNKDDLENRPLERQNFNWFKYIWYLICCGTNDKKISYYEDFRAKLISEENIIQSYLDVYKLLKTNNLPKISII